MAEPHSIPDDPRFQNISGRTFGKLTVLFYAGRKSGKYSLWHCRCECGREATIVSSCLTLGRTTSCLYCFRHKPKPNRRSDFIDLAGQRFGRLIVIALDRHSKTKRGSRTYWRCNCDCGESIIARGDSLASAETQGCGCMSIIKKWRDKPKPDTRRCSKCGEDKPLTLEFFYRHPQSKYGLNPKCKECVKKAHAATYHRQAGKARMQCLIAYSGNPPRCQCPGCTETHLEFLTIDHIKGDGAAHRRSISFQSLYPWLVRHNFPSGFRVLCWNCNSSRGKYGYCPHEISL